MDKMQKWLAYNDLAWTDLLLSGPEEYAGETAILVKAITDNSTGQV